MFGAKGLGRKRVIEKAFQIPAQFPHQMRVWPPLTGNSYGERRVTTGRDLPSQRRVSVKAGGEELGTWATASAAGTGARRGSIAPHCSGLSA